MFVATPDFPYALRVMAWIHLGIAVALALFGVVLAVSQDAGWFGILTVFAFALAIGALSVYWIRRTQRSPNPRIEPVEGP